MRFEDGADFLGIGNLLSQQHAATRLIDNALSETTIVFDLAAQFLCRQLGNRVYQANFVGIPQSVPCALHDFLREAEAIREKRARLIKAEAEMEASEKLTAASAMMAGNPAALELRRMQMVAEVGAENNSTIVALIPSDFVTLAKSLTEFLREHTGVEPTSKK